MLQLTAWPVHNLQYYSMIYPKFRRSAFQAEFEKLLTDSDGLSQAFKPNQQGDIWISWGAWNRLKAGPIFKQMQEWNIHEGLWIRNNAHSVIITEIHQITFSNIQSLGLVANNIQTLQLLPRMIAPNLKFLRIDENLIRSLKSLRKMKIPNLIRISLDNNLINEGWESLSYLGTSCLEWVDIQGFPDDRQQMQSAQYLAKLESRHFSKILLRARERIQPNIIVRNTLKSKSLTNSQVYLRP